MPVREVGTLAGSNRVGFNTRTRTIAAVTTATQDINGNRPIMLYSLQAAANGYRTSRGLKLGISGGGLASQIQTNIASITSTTSTSSTFIPTVQNLTGLPNTLVASPSGNFTITIYAHTSGSNTAPLTNNNLETTTTGTTSDDLRIGNTSSLNYWVAYGYYMVPTAPTSCSASFTATTASVSWTAPSDNGDTGITDYVIEYTTFPNFDAGQVFTTTTTNTSLDIGVGAYATWYFRVYARNAVGSSQRSNTASATASNPPTWNTESLNEIVYVGTAYTVANGGVISLSADNATSYTLNGSLPAGMSLSTTTGNITGTPTTGATQEFSFTVTANSASGNVESNSFTITRKQRLPVWTDQTINSTNARVGVLFSDSVTATGASSYTSIGLPAIGLSLSASGTVSGTPTSTAQTFFSITASNSDDETITANFSFTAKPPLPVWSDQTLSITTTKAKQNYIDGVSATNATSYSLVTPNTLPTGISLNPSTGAITGTPTVVGTYNFLVRAANAIAETITTGTLSLVVQPAGSGKVWNGTTWIEAPFKVWNGTQWIEAQAKVWNGTIWADPSS